jgi:hypothetical protein
MMKGATHGLSMSRNLILMFLHDIHEVAVLGLLNLRRIFPFRPLIVSRQWPDRLIVLQPSANVQGLQFRAIAHILATLAVPTMHLLSLQFAPFHIVKLVAGSFVLPRINLELVEHLWPA